MSHLSEYIVELIWVYCYWFLEKQMYGFDNNQPLLEKKENF